MARRPNGKHVRLNLAISPTTNLRLDRLQLAMDARSRLEVISRVICIYEHLLNEQSEGAKIIIRNGVTEKQILIGMEGK